MARAEAAEDRQYERPAQAEPVVVLHEENLRFIDEIALTRGCIEHPLILVDCGVGPEDFEHPGFDLVWRALRDCYASTQACDPHTLALTLTRVVVEVQHERERELGPEEASKRAVDPRLWPRQIVMALLASPAPPPIDILRNVVPNILARRKLKSWSKDTTQLQGRVVEKLNLGGISYGDIAEEVATQAEQYRQSLKTSNGRNAVAILEEIENSRPAPLVMTGIPQLDAATAGGMYPGLWVHGGPTGGGKSMTALWVCRNRAAVGRHTAYISTEDPEKLWMARLLSSYGPTPMNPALILAEFNRDKRTNAAPVVDPDWMTQAKDAFRPHGEFMHFIDARKDPRPSRIAHDIRFYKTVHGCDLSIIDYIQGMKAEDPKMSGPANRTVALTHAVDLIKEASVSVDAVVCMLTQYSREEFKNGKEPTLQAPRDCGTIENASEAMTLLWRDEDEVLHCKVGKLKVASVAGLRYIVRAHPVTGAHLGWEIDTGPVGTPPEPERPQRRAPTGGRQQSRPRP